jgi:glycosyltransferase involved in cell wall biosynthesis
MNSPSSDSASKPTALFVAAEQPYPTIGGGPIRTASLLEYLAKRFSVHAVIFREPGAPDPVAAMLPGRVDKIDVIELPYMWKGEFARFWRTAWRLARNSPPLFDRFSGFGDVMEKFVAGRNYDVAFVEHFWNAPYAAQLRDRTKHLILDLHNVESAWHFSMADSERGLPAWGFRRFADASLEHERFWMPQYDDILTTSESDAELVRSIVPETRVSVYQNSLPYMPPPPRSEQLEVIFSGNLQYPPNVQAVQFFNREIWPALKSRWPELHWKILSRNPGLVQKMVDSDPKIELTGFVPDAVAVIAQSQVAIVPVLAGSGTRIKILEAWAAGTPVVSTTLGAEGLICRDRDNILLADDPESFTAAISELLALPDTRAHVGAAGRRLYEERYTWQAAWTALDRVLAGTGRTRVTGKPT